MTLPPTRAYQEATIRSADSVQLVIMLHDMLITDLNRCATATSAGDIPLRSSEASHALLVVDQLQRGLDTEHGGETARTLERVYAITRGKILAAQVNEDAELFQRLAAMYARLRDEWTQVRSTAAQPQKTKVPPAEEARESQRAWNV